MIKKFLILKTEPIKAQFGNKTSDSMSNFLPQKWQNKIIGNQLPKNFLDITDPIEQRKAMDQASVVGQNKIGGVSNLANAALPAVGMGANYLFDNAQQKNQKFDSFGSPIMDNKQANLEIGKTVTGDAIKGAELGAQIGKMIPIPGAGLIAEGAGLVGGAITGLITGKKKVKKEQFAYNQGLQSNMANQQRQQDTQNSQYLYGKEGMKLGKISIPKSELKTLILRGGGKIEEPGAVNVVVKGKLHRENNNLGNKDKGIPVIDSEGKKEYEVEAGEIIFRQDVTFMIEDYAKKYKETQDNNLFEELGKKLVPELLKNTQDNYGQFGVKVKENAVTDRK